MKTQFWAIILGVLLGSCALLSLFFLLPSSAASRAVIKSGGQVITTIPLSVNQEFIVTNPNGGSNTVTVRDGKIAVTSADCPDHYCVNRGFCDSGAPIVCLPNKLVISFVGDTEIDGAAG